MPLVNGQEWEYGDIKVSVLGLNCTGLRGITYKKKQNKEAVGGQGNNPKAVQRGEKSYDGSLTLLKSDVDLLDAAAQDAGFEDLVDVPGNLITITASYQKDGAAVALNVDVIKNVEFLEAEDGMKKGDMFKEITLPFIALGLTKKRI
jgi:hypothetical protein